MAGALLDDPKTFSRFDKGDMLSALRGFPHQFEAGLVPAEGVERPATRFERVIVAGMGGSAVGGDILLSWFLSAGGPPIHVTRSYQLPAWASEKTFLFASSYSGNTSETLSQFEQALEKGVPLVAITSGGELARRAEEEGVPLVRIPDALQPRAAVGHLFAAMVSTLRALDVKLPEEHYSAGVQALHKLSRDFGPESPTQRNPAKQVAEALREVNPIVYGVGPMLALARRWANQFNENAKVLSFRGSFPEMNHNDIVGWEEDARSKHFGAVMIHEGTEQGEEKRRLEITMELLRRQTKAVVEVVPDEPHLLARMLHALYLGDYASIYLAFARGVDPTPVPPIDRLKTALRNVK
ncbi:MAG: bifunctional phosphoglucose/phosphomannose isomerase [Methanobacteriota archaeon]